MASNVEDDVGYSTRSSSGVTFGTIRSLVTPGVGPFKSPSSFAQRPMSPRRVFPKRVHGSLDEDAPFWKGETAEKRMAGRIARRASESRKKRKRGGRTSGGASDDVKTLRRLERALSRRKTKEAQLRVAARIKELKAKLGQSELDLS